MTTNDIDRAQVETQLARILSSAPFLQSDRSAALLRYLVDRSLRAEGDRLKEYTVGVEALGRAVSFDPRTDPIVRAEASRLRARLERYYAGDGQADPLLIELPKGAYTMRFTPRSVDAPTPVPPPAALASVDESRPTRRRSLAWPVLALALAAAAVAADRWSVRSLPTAREAPFHLDVVLQTDEELGSDVGTDVVIAPDGSAVVFVSLDSLGISHLRVRRFDGTPPTDLPGTRGARGPFWSPDSRWIAFWAHGQLLKIAADGGVPVALAESQDLLGGYWGDDDTIVAALVPSGGKLWRVGTTPGSTPTVVLDLTAEGIAPQWPQLLPDGKSILYTAVTTLGDDRARIEIASIDDGRRTVLVEGGTFGRFVAPGYVTYVNQGTLFAVRFDPQRRRIRGAAVPVLRDVAYSSTFGHAQLSLSSTGVLVYREGASDGRVVVAQVDSAGAVTPLLAQPGNYEWPALAPDGRRLALSSVVNGDPTLSLFTLRGQTRIEWTRPGLYGGAWTRDGRYLVARRQAGMVWARADGGEPRALLENGRISVPWSFAPNDRLLAYATVDSATHLDVWTVAIEKTGDGLRATRPTALLRSRSYESYPALSGDGRWLAYASDELDGPGVFVRAVADTSRKVLVFRGARAPRWSRTGRRLYFVTAAQRLMSVPYDVTGGQFVAGAAVPFTALRFADTGVLPNYDVGVDDGAVVALLPAHPPTVNRVRMIRGFPQLLREAAP